MGRPTTFSAELALTICAGLADGKSLRSICSAEGMPDRATVFRWLEADEAFRDQYARARDAQAEAHVDDMIDIADDGTNDFVLKQNADGESYAQVNSEHIQRSKLRVDTRKWIAERMKPKKYGSKVALTDGDGGPLTVNVVQRASNRPSS